jgi:hypothetical protein
VNNNLDRMVRLTAQDAAREATKAEIQEFAKQVMGKVQQYLSRPQPDVTACLALTLLAEIISESAGISEPLPAPLQKRPGYRAETKSMAWTAAEKRNAERIGAPVWIHSESENGGGNE